MHGLADIDRHGLVWLGTPKRAMVQGRVDHRVCEPFDAGTMKRRLGDSPLATPELSLLRDQAIA